MPGEGFPQMIVETFSSNKPNDQKFHHWNYISSNPFTHLISITVLWYFKNHSINCFTIFLFRKQWLCFAGSTMRRYPTSKTRSSSSTLLEQPWGNTPWPMAKEKPQQDGRRGEFTFGIKPHSRQRRSEGSNIPCAHQDTGTPQRLRQNYVWSISCGGMGQQWTAPGARLSVQQTWVWHEPSWRRLPLTPPYSYQNLHRPGKYSLRAQTEPCLHQDPGERSSDTTRDWPRLAHECPGVSSRGVGRWWPAAELGALSACIGPFEEGHHYLHYLHHSLAPNK